MGIKERVTARVVDLFSHSERPLQNTEKYEGDPGLFGPGSISWEVLGDVSSFVGGIRALLIQAAHPEVAAGVADHSSYREDPLGRKQNSLLRYINDLWCDARNRGSYFYG